MDLNRTTTLSSRRKTFTVSSGNNVSTLIKEGKGPFDQTFSSGGGGGGNGVEEADINDNNNMTFVSQAETSHVGKHLIPVNGAGVEEQVNMEAETDLGAEFRSVNISTVSSFASVNTFLEKLVHHRNTKYACFVTDDCHNESGASSEPMLETSDIDESKNSQDLEFELLQWQENVLKEEIASLSTTIAIETNRSQASVEKYQKRTKELRRKTEQNKKATKEARNKQSLYKKEARNITLLAKDLADRMDFPKKILEKFCNVNAEGAGVCKDVDFCQDFSGGKCFTRRKKPE